MENEEEVEGGAEPGHASDAEILAEVLADVDSIAGMIERTREAVQRGMAEVRLIPRGKGRTIEGALDELGDALTRTTLGARAQQAQRDGIVSPELAAQLEAATGEEEDA